MKNNKSQAILAYALLIVFVVAALITIAGYVKKRVQGSYKGAADKIGFGEQYDADTVVESESTSSGN